MQREKRCQYCHTYFFYEDGIDRHGPALQRQESDLIEQKSKIIGYCPKCVDPHRIRGMTYMKSTILTVFRKHLAKKGIQSQYLDDESLIPMLLQFPRSNQLYSGNNTYRTFTIFPNTIFMGKYGEFRMGEIAYQRGKMHPDRMVAYREVICCRCSTPAIISPEKVLIYFLGMQEKRCQHCDAKHYVSPGDHKRNTSGLNRNGSSKSEYSDRALAKALNVSRNDFMRHKIIKPEPPLPLGTDINGLRIEEAYWDDKTYSPRYLLVCDSCQETFTCLQKRVELMQHFCQKEKQCTQ